MVGCNLHKVVLPVRFGRLSLAAVVVRFHPETGGGCSGRGRYLISGRVSLEGILHGPPLIDDRSERMQAGRDLDALVAEKVMKNPLGRPSFEVAQKWFTDLPHYSTDIAAAWEVVEELKGQCRLILRTSRLSISQSSVVSAAFVDCGPLEEAQYMCREAVLETAPHAICLAALKAVGGQA